ncbi:MAG: hypothetical protein K0B11_07280 [Mariniphaga sp.]|nr:hypothetical protein [Mariniphaga sp.]
MKVFFAGIFFLLFATILTAQEKTITENKDISAFTAGLAGSVRLSSKVSANLEYLHPFTDDLPGANPFSLGVDIDTGGHLFQLILSNSQQIFTQGLYTATHGN